LTSVNYEDNDFVNGKIKHSLIAMEQLRIKN